MRNHGMLLSKRFFSCREARPSSIYKDIERGNKKIKMDDMKWEYLKEKLYKVEETWECEWLENFKSNDKIKNFIGIKYLCKRLVSEDSLLTKK